MGIEYNNIYLHIQRRPSPKYVMISIPLYMYRIETNEFEHGLNFFQKAVLKFKAKPGLDDLAVAEYLGLDPRLVLIIISELKDKKLINNSGSLTFEGKQKLNEIDGLVVNVGKKKIGYVFKYINLDMSYQYYVDKLNPADILKGKSKYPLIVTGKKGDGDDYTEVPTYLDNLFQNKINFNSPTEQEILQLIQNSNRKGVPVNDDELQKENLAHRLGVRYLNEHPEVVWVCTYVYLYENENGTYEPDWRVLDPFGFGDNTALKFYINHCDNENLLKRIEKSFSDAKVINNKTFNDYQNHLDKLIEDKLFSDFSYGVNTLDENLQLYLRAIVKNYILLNQNQHEDLDPSLSFSLNLQNVLENILKQDKEVRSIFYDRVYDDLDNSRNLKRHELIKIYRLKLFSSDTQVPKPLKNVSKGSLKYGKSMLTYLTSFILTYKYDNTSVLFKILNNRIETIIEISQLRNNKGHGQTAKENTLKSLSKDLLEKYYDFIKSFINDYIKN